MNLIDKETSDGETKGKVAGPMKQEVRGDEEEEKKGEEEKKEVEEEKKEEEEEEKKEEVVVQEEEEEKGPDPFQVNLSRQIALRDPKKPRLGINYELEGEDVTYL